LQATDLALVLEAFRLGGLVEPHKSAARGAMGEIFRVVTDAGRFAVKELFPWNEGLGVAEELEFTRRARAAGVRIPMEIVDPAGNAIVAVEGTRFRAYEWLDFEPAFRPPTDVSVARAVGQIAGRLHAIGKATDAAIDPWYTTPPGLHQLRELTHRAVGVGRPWATAFSAELMSLGALAEVARAPAAGRVLRCHRDLDPSNVRPLADGTLVVVDWEDVGPLAVDQELGCVLLSWCTDGRTVSSAAVAALLAGYAMFTGSPVEISRSTFAVAAARYLNFLAAQAGTALDPQAPPAHAAFGEERVHELLRTPLRTGLLDELAAAANPVLARGTREG
jgi:Ser/Thr protein kinase RdoA (MazF antagonist)